MHRDLSTSLHADYLAVMQDVCKNEPAAFRWFVQVMDAALLWDHIVDGDPIDRESANRTMTAITMDWILNDWFHKSRVALIPILSGCLTAWKNAGPGSRESYYAYVQIPNAICLLLHGQAGVDKYMPTINSLVERERFDDMRRDHPPFFIVGLPRSRTAWLAAFLTDGDVTCHHELCRWCDKPQDYLNALSASRTPVVGDSSPLMALTYAGLRADLPKGHKVIFILRDPKDARRALKAELEAHGLEAHNGDEGWTKYSDAFQAMRDMCPDAMSFSYEKLNEEAVMRELAEYATGLPFNAQRWKIYDEMKITAIPQKVLAHQRLIR
jgi:hypothetical protein